MNETAVRKLAHIAFLYLAASENSRLPKRVRDHYRVQAKVAAGSIGHVTCDHCLEKQAIHTWGFVPESALAGTSSDTVEAYFVCTSCLSRISFFATTLQLGVPKDA